MERFSWIFHCWLQLNDAQVEPFRHAGAITFSFSILSKSLSTKGESLFMAHHPSLFSYLNAAREKCNIPQ
jgi:hypothetical protein